MMIICLLLCSLSLTSARVFPRTGVNDDFNGVKGVIYDIPEYEDPEVSLFKLIARGIMPVYTIRNAVKNSKDLLNKNDMPHYQTNDIKKGLDTVIIQLQEAKHKLESGNNNIYLDIDKSVLFLENLKHHLYIDLHNASPEQSPIYNESAELPIDIITSTDLPMDINTSTEQPSVIDETVFKFVPSSEVGWMEGNSEEVKTDVVDDVSSAKVEKVDQEDKTLIRKKWSYKLSSIF